MHFINKAKQFLAGALAFMAGKQNNETRKTLELPHSYKPSVPFLSNYSRSRPRATFKEFGTSMQCARLVRKNKLRNRNVNA